MSTNKALGQHWLNNRAILEEIADLAAGVEDSGDILVDADRSAFDSSEKQGRSELCVEIGPGLGTLTTSLLRRFDKVIAVEYDKKLADNLPQSFPGKNLEVINQDILKFDFSAIQDEYVVAGNIPYYITSPIVERILTANNLPEKVVLLMQKEVAERVVSRKESVLSLFVKNRAEATLGPVVKREEFTPAPKVDSRVLILTPFKTGSKYDEKVMDLIKKAFKNPRKKLKHNIPEIAEKYADLRPADLHLDDYYGISIGRFCD